MYRNKVKVTDSTILSLREKNLWNSANSCHECGHSVAPGSGRYVNRIPNLNSYEERLINKYPFPLGSYMCADCDSTNREEKKLLSAYNSKKQLTINREIDGTLYPIIKLRSKDKAIELCLKAYHVLNPGDRYVITEVDNCTAIWKSRTKFLPKKATTIPEYVPPTKSSTSKSKYSTQWLRKEFHYINNNYIEQEECYHILQAKSSTTAWNLVESCYRHEDMKVQLRALITTIIYSTKKNSANAVIVIKADNAETAIKAAKALKPIWESS